MAEKGLPDIAKVVEMSATSETGFEDAIRNGLEALDPDDRYSVTGMWVKEQRVMVDAGEIEKFQVNLLITMQSGGDRPIKMT